MNYRCQTSILFKINGINTVAPVVDEVLKDSAAFAAGNQPLASVPRSAPGVKGTF